LESLLAGLDMDGNTRLVDLIPRDNRFYIGILVTGVAVIAVLEACFAAMPLLVPHTTDGAVAAFDLDGEGSLAVWVSSFTLAAAAGSCLVVWVLSSCYQRTRRIWLWAAACWLFLSIDECSSLHEGFKEMMTLATGERLSHDGSMWWAIPYSIVLGTTGLRLLAAMRNCLSACGLLIAVAVLYAAAVLGELGWITAKDTFGVMLEEGCEMLGNLCLLTSTLLYARYVAEQFRQQDLPISSNEFSRPGPRRRRSDRQRRTVRSSAAVGN